jgi:hypothetical protein
VVPGSIEVEQLDTVLPFVDEDEKHVGAEATVAQLLARRSREPVERLAHVAGLQGDIDFEGCLAKSDHRAPPFRVRRNSAMKAAARGTQRSFSTRMERPSLIGIISWAFGESTGSDVRRPRGQFIDAYVVSMNHIFLIIMRAGIQGEFGRSYFHAHSRVVDRQHIFGNYDRENFVVLSGISPGSRPVVLSQINRRHASPRVALVGAPIPLVEVMDDALFVQGAADVVIIFAEGVFATDDKDDVHLSQGFERTGIAQIR